MVAFKSSPFDYLITSEYNNMSIKDFLQNLYLRSNTLIHKDEFNMDNLQAFLVESVSIYLAAFCK